MSTVLKLCTIMVLLVYAMAKPLRQGPPAVEPAEGNSPDDAKNDQMLGLQYEHYLKEVVDVLESDSEFKKRLETANVTDIKSGKIAMYLDLVNHNVRDRLHELKRKELARLAHLARLQLKSQTGTDLIMNAMGRGVKKFDIPDHLDLGNQHTFEIKDLESLIKKTTSDLEKLDEQRRHDFKEYEMEKKFEREEHLKEMSEEDKLKEKHRMEELEKKHKEHPKINHPGSKDQFEEVWEKQDHLQDQEFDPRTFFFTHDQNGDMEWSIDEVDSVLQLELDKVYDARNSPDEDDPFERDEEMNRMREHIFGEMDKDKNLRISYKEFIDYTGQHGDNPEFKKDDGWKTLDEEEPVFDDDDFQNFVREHHAQPGVVSPPDPNLHFQPEGNVDHQQQLNQHHQQQQQQFNQHQQQQQLNQHQQQQQLNQHQQQQQLNQQHQQQQFGQQHQQQQQKQQQQFGQQHLQQQQMNQQHQQQQQLNQQHQQQQQLNQQHQQQQQLNQQQRQQQPNQPPAPPHQQQQQTNQPPVTVDAKVLQQQLQDLQDKLNQQKVVEDQMKQQQQQQQQQHLGNQPPV